MSLHPTFAGILAAHGAPIAQHASGLTLHRVRTALERCGWQPSQIDWQHADGRHSITMQGVDGQLYRLTISLEGGQ